MSNKVTTDQARKEFEEWLVIRDKEPTWKEFWEFCAEILEVNHQFYDKLSSLEDAFDGWSRAIIDHFYRRV